MEVRSSFTVLFGLLLLSIVISSSPLVSIHTVDASTDSDFFEDFEEEDFEEEDFEEEDFELHMGKQFGRWKPNVSYRR